MRVPPSQSLTTCAAARSACSRRFSRNARVTRVSRVPKVKVSTCGAACVSACGERQVLVGALLHRARHVDQHKQLARPRAALEPAQPQDLAVVAHALAQACAGDRRKARAAPASGDDRAAAAGGAAPRAPIGAAGRSAPARSKRRSTNASPRAAACPDSLISSANSGGSSPPAVLLNAQRARRSRLPLPAPRRRGNGCGTARRRRRGAPAAALSVARPACLMSSSDRGPSRPMAARNVVVWSGATAKPLTRSSADEIDKGARGARDVRRLAHAAASAMMRIQARPHMRRGLPRPSARRRWSGGTPRASARRPC